jgi:hypothetical protein
VDEQRQRSAPVAGKGVRVSRVSKRPGRAPAGSREAARILSELEVREGLRLDQAAIDTLRACCSMRPPRNAAAIVNAIKARLEYSQPKPKQEIGVSGEMTFHLVDPFARKPE